MEVGPVISLVGFPIIISKVETNIAPRTPSAINTVPFFSSLSPLDGFDGRGRFFGYVIRNAYNARDFLCYPFRQSG